MELTMYKFLVFTTGGDVFRILSSESHMDFLKRMLEVDLNKSSFLLVHDEEEKPLLINLREINAIRPN